MGFSKRGSKAKDFLSDLKTGIKADGSIWGRLRKRKIKHAKRALSARKYLVDRGVSPLKVMVNFASAADYVTENITPEGRYQNQRVEIELVYVPMF
ncbi:MAG: hypothetical protein CMN89_06475 [Sutterellaceae bacterium]|nr:hypothetical protein [Sutterellaceae bacterium]